MRKTVHLSLATIILASFVSILISSPALGTTVDSDVTTDTTWNEAGSPYIVTKTIHVTQGSTLTIQEGTSVKFDGFYSLIVDGILIVTGTQTKRVTFTTNMVPATPGDWSSIKFTSTSSASLVSHASIEYAKTGIYAEQSSPTILNNTLSNIQTRGIDAYESYSDIRDNVITGASIGIKAQYGSPTILDNTLTHNVNGIDLKGINSRIEKNEVRHNGVGIILNASSPKIVSNDISFNGEGIISQDNSNPTIEDNTISSNTKTGIWCVSSTNTFVSRNTISDNMIGIEADQSVLMISDNVLSYNLIGIQAEDGSELDVIDTPISNSNQYSLVLEASSYVTTINSTFELERVSVDSTSTLVVRNYLIVMVETKEGLPLEGAKAEIQNKDDNDVLFTLYTDTNGATQLKLVTDRIYLGSSVATENPTHVEVSFENLTFLSNPREVDMRTSHIETFVEGEVDGNHEDHGESDSLISLALVVILIITTIIILSAVVILRRRSKEEERRRKDRKKPKKRRKSIIYSMRSVGPF